MVSGKQKTDRCVIWSIINHFSLFSTLNLKTKYDYAILSRMAPETKIRPTLGEAAQQIARDIPTTLVVGRYTLALNNTVVARLNAISMRVQHHLQLGLQLPEVQNVQLPLMTPMALNTAVQEILGRATGILNPEESWINFLRRDGMTVVSSEDWQGMDRIATEEPDGIIGMQYSLPTHTGAAIQYGGTPRYFRVPTKYRGVGAIVEFMPVGYDQKPLDQLLQAEITTPLIILRVPTQEFLPPNR